MTTCVRRTEDLGITIKHLFQKQAHRKSFEMEAQFKKVYADLMPSSVGTVKVVPRELKWTLWAICRYSETFSLVGISNSYFLICPYQLKTRATSMICSGYLVFRTTG